MMQVVYTYILRSVFLSPLSFLQDISPLNVLVFIMYCLFKKYCIFPILFVDAPRHDAKPNRALQVIVFHNICQTVNASGSTS